MTDLHRAVTAVAQQGADGFATARDIFEDAILEAARAEAYECIRAAGLDVRKVEIAITRKRY